MTRRVLITGLGTVCANRFDHADFWAGLTAGHNHIRRWHNDWLPDFSVRYAAPVDDEALSRHFAEDFGTSWHEPMERSARFALAATWQAVRDAGLAGTVGPLQAKGLGVMLGVGVSERAMTDMLPALGPDGPDWQRVVQAFDRLDPASGLVHSRDEAAARIARRFGLSGSVQTISTACAGAAHAIGLAFRMVRRGETPWMLAGGSDSVLNPSTMVALHLLGAPSKEQRLGDCLSRPFDLRRSGLVAGEGAGMILLEDEHHALARGAPIHAELAGFGSSMDAYRLTAPHPQAEGATLAMSRALKDARLQPSAIAHVNAHGSSTPLNDKMEAQAIRQVFADGDHWRRVSVTANKSMLGHLIAAAGGPELIATALTVKTGDIPPTVHLDEIDPECELDHVRHAVRHADVPAALSNSFGFGGLNACLAVKRYA